MMVVCAEEGIQTDCEGTFRLLYYYSNAMYAQQPKELCACEEASAVTTHQWSVIAKNRARANIASRSKQPSGTSNIIGVQGSNDHIALLFHMQSTVYYAPPKALFEVLRPPSYDWVSTLHQHLRGALGEANKALD